MKKKDLNELKEKSAEALKKMVGETIVVINTLRSKIYTGQEKNIRSAKKERIKRAIMLTLIKEKEMKEVV